MHTLLMYAVGFAPVYLPVIGFVRKMKKFAEIKSRISSTEAELERVRREYEESEAFLKSNAGIKIPPRFRQEVSLDYIIKGLKAREFVSLDQAFFKCEEAFNRGEFPDWYIE